MAAPPPVIARARPAGRVEERADSAIQVANGFAGVQADALVGAGTDAVAGTEVDPSGEEQVDQAAGEAESRATMVSAQRS